MAELPPASKRICGIGRVVRSLKGEGFAGLQIQACTHLSEVRNPYADADMKPSGKRKPVHAQPRSAKAQVSIDWGRGEWRARGLEGLAVTQIAGSRPDIPISTVGNCYFPSHSCSADSDTGSEMTEWHPDSCRSRHLSQCGRCDRYPYRTQQSGRTPGTALETAAA